MDGFGHGDAGLWGLCLCGEWMGVLTLSKHTHTPLWLIQCLCLVTGLSGVQGVLLSEGHAQTHVEQHVRLQTGSCQGSPCCNRRCNFRSASVSMATMNTCRKKKKNPNWIFFFFSHSRIFLLKDKKRSGSRMTGRLKEGLSMIRWRELQSPKEVHPLGSTTGFIHSFIQTEPPTLSTFHTRVPSMPTDWAAISHWSVTLSRPWKRHPLLFHSLSPFHP